jgi:hypothetical protein
LDNYNDLRDKFRQGTATEQEQEVYFRLLTLPDDEAEEARWRAVWNGEETIVLTGADLVRRDRILDRLLSDIGLGAEVHAVIATRQGRAAQKRSKFRRAGWVAGMMLFGAAVCVGHFFLGDRERKSRSYVVVTPGARFELDESSLTPEIPFGLVKKELPSPVRAADLEPVTLPDGSTILLNTDGKARYPTDFSIESRDVLVTGEAFFNVRYDPSKPFRVRSKNIVATVVGTLFDFKTIGDKVVITVIRGQVRVGDGTHVLGEVNANYQMIVNTLTLEHYQRKIPPGEEMFWETQYLYLGEVNFGEAMRRIGRRFNVRIEVANGALNDCVIHSDIPHMDNVMDNVMDIVTILSKTLNARVVKKKNRILIDGGSCR